MAVSKPAEQHQRLPRKVVSITPSKPPGGGGRDIDVTTAAPFVDIVAKAVAQVGGGKVWDVLGPQERTLAFYAAMRELDSPAGS